MAVGWRGAAPGAAAAPGMSVLRGALRLAGCGCM
jgi:hypothetical protein